MNAMFGLSSLGLSSRSALVAHQGGWDEVLLIGGPLLAIVGLLLLAKRRLERVESSDTTSSAPGSTSGSDPASDLGSSADASAPSASPEQF